MNSIDLILIKKLEEAANEANPDKAEEVLWLDDDKFSEIEDFIPGPIGVDGVRNIHNWIRENGKPGNNVKFKDVKKYDLNSEVFYVTAFQELNFDQLSMSRVTFIFVKKENKWGIIHAHYSKVPEN